MGAVGLGGARLAPVADCDQHALPAVAASHTAPEIFDQRHGGTVREMIADIPLPKSFSISRVPDEGLTTNREGIGSKVAGTVSCLWLRQWGEARRPAAAGLAPTSRA